MNNLKINEGGTLGNNYNLRVGQTITIEDGIHNTEWMVAHIHRYPHTGNPENLIPSVVLVTKSYLPNAAYDTEHYSSTSKAKLPMNSTNTTGVSQNPNNPLYEITQGIETKQYQGYYGCDMNQIYLPAIGARLKSLLGDYMIDNSYPVSMSVDMNIPPASQPNRMGYVSGAKWITTNIILPSETDFYGASYFSSSPYEHPIAPGKLAVYNFINIVHHGRVAHWTRNVAYSTCFCRNSIYGMPAVESAGYLVNIKPMILITSVPDYS